MVGRIEEIPRWRAMMRMYEIIGLESFDYSVPKFALSRAIYYASVVKDTASKDIGQKYIFGAAFGKPIVNSTTAFAFASPITISADGDEENADVQAVNDWFEKHHDTVFDTLRYSIRDGVSYLRINDGNAIPRMIAGERVTIQVDPLTGDTLGYDVEVVVNENEEKGTNVKYRTEYRKVSPQIKIIKIIDNKESVHDTVEREGETLLDIVAFHNEREPSFIYGVSEFQNLYYLMSNYHAVLENAIKNNIFNSTAIPYIKGIENVKTFLEQHGERQDDGTYAFDWGAEKVLIGGEKFDVKMMNGTQNAGEAKTLLHIIFYLICQTSETPEFVMGTAVSSSKASVSEQMPVVLRKAKRKQKQMEGFLRELAELVASKLGKTLPKDYTVVLPDILDEDMKLNIEIVKVLSEEGIITDKVKALMLGLGSWVGDLDNEIKLAKEEQEVAEEKFAREIKLANEPHKELENNE